MPFAPLPHLITVDFIFTFGPFNFTSHNYGWENKTHPVSSLVSPQSLKTTKIPYNWTKCIHAGSEILCIT